MTQMSHGSGSSRFGFRFVAIFLAACKLRWSVLYARTKRVFAIFGSIAKFKRLELVG